MTQLPSSYNLHLDPVRWTLFSCIVYLGTFEAPCLKGIFRYFPYEKSEKLLSLPPSAWDRLECRQTGSVVDHLFHLLQIIQVLAFFDIHRNFGFVLPLIRSYHLYKAISLTWISSRSFAAFPPIGNFPWKKNIKVQRSLMTQLPLLLGHSVLFDRLERRNKFSLA